MFTPKSTVGAMAKNPVGSDLLHALITQTGLPEKIVFNPVVGALPLSLLPRVTNGVLDAAAVDGIVAMLNNAAASAPDEPEQPAHAWWKEAVAYQIYPRSFADANGDGIGDLQGIRQKLPYLKALGVTLLWLSPIYDSPNDDGGYDIRDYHAILADFGTMEDFDALLADAHALGMRLIMDLVVNHSSDEHAWFKAALADASSPEHGYYIWRKGKNGKEPNNWKSFFSGPAWNYYPEQDAWALHLFSKKQPDLNWDNPALRAEVHSMVNWWLNKGVDGFRLDVINFISKSSLDDGSEALAGVVGHCGIEHFFYGRHLHEYLHEMHEACFAGRDVFTVGECPGIGLEMSKRLTADSRKELNTVFNFDHLQTPGATRFGETRYDLRYLKKYLITWQQQYGNACWQSLFYDNHDNPRMVGKVNPEESVREVLAKLLATIQMTLRGTPFVYQGQELGMPNAQFTSMDEIRDIESVNLYAELCQTMPPQEAFAKVARGSRDNARTPMPWTAAAHGGFTTGTPWLRATPGYEVFCAEAQQAQEGSVLQYYKAAIALRKACPALVYGSFVPLFSKQKRYNGLFCYLRVYEGKKYYIECNLLAKKQPRPAPLTQRHQRVLGSYGAIAPHLRPYEANVYEITES